MIEEEPLVHDGEEMFILRFVNMDDPDPAYEPGETHYAHSVGSPPKRQWAISFDRDEAHCFDSVSWARRFSKIVEQFRIYVDDPHWKTEVIKIKRVRKNIYETAWPRDAVTLLGQIVSAD